MSADRSAQLQANSADSDASEASEDLETDEDPEDGADYERRNGRYNYYFARAGRESLVVNPPVHADIINALDVLVINGVMHPGWMTGPRGNHKFYFVHAKDAQVSVSYPASPCDSQEEVSEADD